MNKMDLLNAEMKARENVDLAWLKIFLQYHPEVMNEQGILGSSENINGTDGSSARAPDTVRVGVQPTETPA
jgi:hypothetical protein